MAILSNLSEKTRTRKSRRVGRGTGCKKGKTCGRGHKGDKARSGYKKRLGKEGGQLPLFRKLPVRGFSNARFKKIYVSINFSKIDFLFDDGETVSLETLAKKGFAVPARAKGVKILSGGELTKKVKVEAMAYSKSAAEKLKELSIEHKIV